MVCRTDGLPNRWFAEPMFYRKDGRDMNRLPVYLLFCCLTAISGPALPPVAGQDSQDGRAPVAQEMPRLDLDQYQFGILRRGSKWTAEKTPETQKIQEGHMAHIGNMARAGKLMAAGPLMSAGDLRGIFIFKAASLDEARALAEEDPAIKSGRLTLELLDWRGTRGIGAKLQEEMKINQNPKYTMAKYHLVLFKRGPRWAPPKSSEDRKLWTDHLRYVQQMLGTSKMAAAGPFVDDSERPGMYVLAAESETEAKALTEPDPAVKAGYLVPEFHAWYVAREVWP
jgi:uncharacterized protein YciI